jgi:hypothetical protein
VLRVVDLFGGVASIPSARSATALRLIANLLALFFRFSRFDRGCARFPLGIAPASR